MTYNEFIENIKSTRGQGNIPDGEYYEAHHIVPKCIGGLPKRISKHTKHNNLIGLYPQEHYEAHKLLAEENPDNEKLLLAGSMIAFPSNTKQKRNLMISGEDYAKIKLGLAKRMSRKMKNVKLSETHRKI